MHYDDGALIQFQINFLIKHIYWSMQECLATHINAYFGVGDDVDFKENSDVSDFHVHYAVLQLKDQGNFQKKLFYHFFYYHCVNVLFLFIIIIP